MKILDYIFAARPMLHLPVWSVFLVSLYYHHEISRDTFSAEDLLILFALSLSAAAAYYINQIHDYESDFINKKIGFLQNKIIRRKSMKSAYLITAIIPLIIAFFISLSTLMILLQLFVLGYIYSAHPFKLKDRPFWGLFANAYAFGFLIPLSILPNLSEHNAGLLAWDTPFYFFFTVASIYTLTTIPDIEGDRRIGKKTLAVIFPLPVVKFVSLLFMLFAAYIAFESQYIILMAIALISSLFIIFSFLNTKISIVLISTKFPVLLLSLLAGYYYPVYLLFIVALFIITRVYYKKRFGIKYPNLQ